ncbi:hypothetical protein BLNAU_15579 [Blattamonas nauphoetae]|uniref:Uncharacterized protein n=1 Tax=Blattamonas nauphoetae TaxID=2049346 RepID=A0ABQ9XAD9_9EUKA|nr:hypothetical protein BLNAU_15579 [Blattamonas nauphoetae]
MLVMLAKDNAKSDFSLVDLHPYTLYLASLLLTSPSAKALTSTNPMISLLVSTISLPPTPVLHCLYTSLMSLKCSRMFGFDEKTKTEYSKFKQQKNVWSPDPSMEYESLLPTPSDLDELSNLAEGHDHPVDTLDEEQDLISQPEMDILEDPVEDSEHNQPADHLDHDDAFSQNELHENDHPHTIETAPTEPPLSNDKKKKKKTRKKATSGQPNSTSTPDYPSNSLEPSFQPMSTHPFSTAPPDQPSQKPLAPTDIEDELNDLDELVLEDEESPHPSERVLKDDGHQNTLQLTVHSDPIHDEDLSDDDNELDTTHNTHSKKFFEGQIVVWNKENSPTVDKGEPTTKKEKQRRVTKAEKQKEEYERLSLLSEIDTLRSKLRQTTTQLEWEKKTSERYKVEMIAIQGQLREESAKWEKERKMRKKTNKKYKELLQQLDDQNNHKQNADENKPNSDWNESDDEPAHPKSGRVSESEGQPLSTPVFDELNPMSFILTPHAEITTITSHTPRSQKEEELRKDTQNSEQDVPTEPLSQIDESKTEEVEKNDENEVKSPNQTISELLAQFQRLQIENERLKKQEEEWKEGSPIKQHLPDSPEHKDGNTDMSHTTSLVTPQKTIEQDSPPMSESYSLIDSFLKDRQDQEKEEKRVLEDTIRREVERKRREEDEERRVRVAGIGERASGMNEKDRAVSLFFLFRVAKHLLKQAKREVKRETERKRKEELERDIHNQTTPERFVVPSQTSHLHRSETRSHVPFLYPFTHTQDTSHQRQQQTQNERVHHTQTQQSSSQHTLQPQSTPTSYTSPFSQHINLAQSLLLPRVMDDGRGVVQALELIKFNEFGKLDRVWMEECFTVMNGTIGRKKKEKRQTQNGDKRNEETDSFEGETIQDMVGEWQHFERLQHEWEEIRKEIEEREWAESALKAVERERENTNHQTGESHTHPHSDSPQVLSSPLQTPQNLDRTSNTMSTVRRESLNLFDTLLGVPDSIQQLHSQAPSTNLLLVSNSSLLNSILCPSNSSSPSLTLSAFPLLVSILLSTTVLEQISVGMREEISLLTDVDHQFHNTFPSHIETQPQPHFMDRRERTHDDEWMSEEQSEREQRQSPKPSIQSEKEDADSDSGQRKVERRKMTEFTLHLDVNRAHTHDTPRQHHHIEHNGGRVLILWTVRKKRKRREGRVSHRRNRKSETLEKCIPDTNLSTRNILIDVIILGIGLDITDVKKESILGVNWRRKRERSLLIKMHRFDGVHMLFSGRKWKKIAVFQATVVS